MAITKITSRVIDSGAITSTHLAAGAVTHSSLSGITTDNVTEGSTNLYYANSLVDSHLSGGTGVTYSSGAISIGQDVGTSATPTFGNITTTGYLAGPATFTIDPAAVGDNTGTVVIAGNLQVDGTTTTINSTTMTVDDLNITLASGAANAAAANGAGLTVDGASATITYDGTNDEWDFNKHIRGQSFSVGAGPTSELLFLSGAGHNGHGTTNTRSVASFNQTGQSAGLWFGARNDETTGIIGTRTTTGNLAFETYNSGWGERMRITYDGNVGIGTTNPLGKFVVSNGGAEGFEIFPGSASGQNSFQHYNRSGSAYLRNRNIASEFTFNLSGASDDAVTFKADGNVGIGTSSPTSYANSQAALVIEDTTSPAIVWSDTGQARDWFAVAQGSGLYFKYADGGGSGAASNVTDVLVLDNSGNVGIGGDPDSSGRLLVQNGGTNQIVLTNNDSATTNLNMGNFSGGGYISQNYYYSSGHQANDNTKGAFEIFIGDDNYAINYHSPGAMGTRRRDFAITSAGYVGIGTNNPVRPLHIHQASNSQMQFTDNNSGSGSADGLRVGWNGTEGQIFLFENADLRFATNNDPKMWIKADGKVGIGTSSPAHLLTVSDDNGGGSAARRITIKSQTHGQNSGFRFDSESANGTARAGGYYFQPGDTDDTTYLGLSATDSDYQMVITREGNVGINKSSGFATGGFGTPMLVIKQLVNSQWGGINLEANGNDAIFAFGTTDAVHQITGSYRINGGYKPIVIGAQGKHSIRFDPNGRVSLGDDTYTNFTSPDLAVHICGDSYSLKIESGTGYSNFGSVNTSYFHITGNRTYYFGNRCEASGGFHTYSDERLKENITPITNALDKVSQMNGITFSWIDAENRGGGDTGKQFGVTAQNMLEVDNELPTLNKDPLASQDEIDNEESTDYYSMDYNRITPFLIEAIKELKTELDAAKARITTLEG